MKYEWEACQLVAVGVWPVEDEDESYPAASRRGQCGQDGAVYKLVLTTCPSSLSLSVACRLPADPTSVHRSAVVVWANMPPLGSNHGHRSPLVMIRL